MAFDLHEWYSSMKNGNAIFAFKGSITAELISSILVEIEQKLDTQGESPKIIKKIYNVLVETLQNLFHHIEEPPENEKIILGERFVIFVFSPISSGVYKIATGNFVKNEKVQLLKDRMDQINFLTQEELKVLYKLVLNNEEFSEKGGGGLGMIDIAKKTGNKLDYKFFNVNQNLSFFCLDVLIS